MFINKYLYSNKYKLEITDQDFKIFKSGRFNTHSSKHALRLHQLSKVFLAPEEAALKLFAYVVIPLPGKNKDHALRSIAIRIAALTGGIILTPAAFFPALLGIGLRLISHSFRPAFSYIDYSGTTDSKGKTFDDLPLKNERPLHIRNHNLGLVPTPISIVDDLRHPVERAHEIVEGILGDSHKPDIIFCHEAFHQEAVKVLCEGVKAEYPYIIYNIAPHISGFNSGAIVLSKYPLDGASFHRLDHMIGPEKLSPRGTLKVRLHSKEGKPILLYSTHTQALVGKKRSDARVKQLEDIQKLMREELAHEPEAIQILVGDLNTSNVNAWGEDNLKPPGQAETEVQRYLYSHFDDIFLNDHDQFGKRMNGQPIYLEADNARLKVQLDEPQGSWHVGPFAKPNPILKTQMAFDRRKNRLPSPEKIEGLYNPKVHWGTKNWYHEQKSNTARFDYILIPKRGKQSPKVHGKAEIRRPYIPCNTQSASTDHLMIDGRIWVE